MTSRSEVSKKSSRPCHSPVRYEFPPTSPYRIAPSSSPVWRRVSRILRPCCRAPTCRRRFARFAHSARVSTSWRVHMALWAKSRASVLPPASQRGLSSSTVVTPARRRVCLWGRSRGWTSRRRSSAMPPSASVRCDASLTSFPSWALASRAMAGICPCASYARVPCTARIS